jgi:hypothetical protein
MLVIARLVEDAIVEREPAQFAVEVERRRVERRRLGRIADINFLRRSADVQRGELWHLHLSSVPDGREGERRLSRVNNV